MWTPPGFSAVCDHPWITTPPQSPTDPVTSTESPWHQIPVMSQFSSSSSPSKWAPRHLDLLLSSPKTHTGAATNGDWPTSSPFLQSLPCPCHNPKRRYPIPTQRLAIWTVGPATMDCVLQQGVAGPMGNGFGHTVSVTAAQDKLRMHKGRGCVFRFGCRSFFLVGTGQKVIASDHQVLDFVRGPFWFLLSLWEFQDNNFLQHRQEFCQFFHFVHHGNDSPLAHMPIHDKQDFVFCL